MNRPQRTLFVLALIPLTALLILLAGCTQCPDVYAVGCTPLAVQRR